ncbi:hypothetical protein IMZ48_43890, partial [Candidatus Bathyarchaeota archaeon]|nr:hypothetical protein [Candidatus Bathyarchaeota archaeon]
MAQQLSSNRRRSSLKLFLLFHLPPVLVTISLVTLHALSLKWAPAHPTSEELALLQFAAKAHEALVVLSLTKVLAHRILYLMVRREGTPFGFLASSFQLTSPVYLFTSEFWAPLAQRGGRSASFNATAVLIVVSFLLAAGASPFSAILMLPRLQWWQMDGDDAVLRSLAATINRRENLTHPVDLFHSPPDSFYPLSISMASLPTARAGPEITRDYTVGFPEIKDLLPQLSISTPQPPNFFNISVRTSFSFDRNKPIAATGRLTGAELARAEIEEGLAIATTPLDLAAADITMRSKILREEFHREDILVKSEPVGAQRSARWKQPVVGVHCRHNITGAGMYAPETVSFSFRDWLYPASTLTLHIDDELRPIRDYLSRPFSQAPRVLPTVMLGSGSGVITPGPVSNVMVFTNSLLYPASSEEGVFLMTACLIKAFWTDSDLWVQPPAIYPPQFSLSTPPEDLIPTTKAKTEGVIEIGSDWLVELDKVDLNSSAY